MAITSGHTGISDAKLLFYFSRDYMYFQPMLYTIVTRALFNHRAVVKEHTEGRGRELNCHRVRSHCNTLFPLEWFRRGRHSTPPQALPFVAVLLLPPAQQQPPDARAFAPIASRRVRSSSSHRAQHPPTAAAGRTRADRGTRPAHQGSDRIFVSATVLGQHAVSQA